MFCKLSRFYLLIILINCTTAINATLGVLVSDSAPFAHRNNDVYSGIEVELVKAIAKELNVKINYVFNDVSRQPPELR